MLDMIGPYTAQQLTRVPIGRYALYLGPLKFFRVSAPEGHLRVEEGKGTPGDGELSWSRVGLMTTSLKAIERSGPRLCAARYNREVGICGECGSGLTHAVSRITGYGPDCRRKLALDRDQVSLANYVGKHEGDFKVRWARWADANPEFKGDNWYDHVTLHTCAPGVPTVYYLYSRFWELLYVGKSENSVVTRLGDHWATKDWGRAIAFAIETPCELAQLAETERREIHRLHAPGNRQCYSCPDSVIPVTAAPVPDPLLAKRHAKILLDAGNR